MLASSCAGEEEEESMYNNAMVYIPPECDSSGTVQVQFTSCTVYIRNVHPKKKIRRKDSSFIPDKNIKKETSKVVNKNNDNTSNEEMDVQRRCFPQKDQDILENALLLRKGDVDKAMNFILDFHENERDAAQGMLGLSTTGQSTLNNSNHVIDLSNVQEATANTSTNVASFSTSVMAQTFHSDHSVVSDTSEEGSVKTHFSDDEMKALVDNQNNEQLSKATKLSYIKLRKKQKDEKEINILLDGYSEGFDLRHKRIAYQYHKGMTINYMKKRMEIVHFYVNDSNKSIEIWAKSLTEKNAKAEKLDVNQMKCKKKLPQYIVHTNVTFKMITCIDIQVDMKLRKNMMLGQEKLNLRKRQH